MLQTGLISIANSKSYFTETEPDWSKLKGIKGVTFQKVPANCSSTGNYMVIFIDANRAKASRDEVVDFMKINEVQTKKYFYPALHMQTAYKKYRGKYQGKLPVAEKAAVEGLALPLFSHMDKKSISKICGLIKEIL